MDCVNTYDANPYDPAETALREATDPPKPHEGLHQLYIILWLYNIKATALKAFADGKEMLSVDVALAAGCQPCGSLRG
jgi:hypothetical protein